MGQTIIGRFETRRGAELAIEHLVQDLGVERTDIFIEAPGSENSAGTAPAGADVESGHPSHEKRGEPALGGEIVVSVELEDELAAKARAYLDDAGATSVETR
ncbi:hypothetical protein [Rhizorhabdus argentea]|uniref:hypothetical protein n=1 Tax=Rhizorhabdus argentea TaxID=1387174 RepID=UPI0030EE3E69